MHRYVQSLLASIPVQFADMMDDLLQHMSDMLIDDKPTPVCPSTPVQRSQGDFLWKSWGSIFCLCIEHCLALSVATR